MWQLPFKAIEADKDLLAERGYALEQDMVQKRSLDADKLTLKNNYAIDYSEEVCTHQLLFSAPDLYLQGTVLVSRKAFNPFLVCMHHMFTDLRPV